MDKSACCRSMRTCIQTPDSHIKDRHGHKGMLLTSMLRADVETGKWLAGSLAKTQQALSGCRESGSTPIFPSTEKEETGS